MSVGSLFLDHLTWAKKTALEDLMHVLGSYSEYVLIKNNKNKKSTAKILSVLQDLHLALKTCFHEVNSAVRRKPYAFGFLTPDLI